MVNSQPLRTRKFQLSPKSKSIDFSFLDNERPIDFEIGAGVGWHAIQFGKAHPDRQLVAIERTRNKFLSLKLRLENHPEIKSVFAYNADAVQLIAAADVKMDRVYILYPNPYPKNKAQRWIHMPFFEALVGKLKPHGEIIIASNIPTYMNEVRDHYKRYGLAIQKEIDILEEYNSGHWSPRTHFEKKYLLRSEPCLQISLCKN